MTDEKLQELAERTKAKNEQDEALKTYEYNKKIEGAYTEKMLEYAKDVREAFYDEVEVVLVKGSDEVEKLIRIGGQYYFHPVIQLSGYTSLRKDLVAYSQHKLSIAWLFKCPECSEVYPIIIDPLNALQFKWFKEHVKKCSECASKEAFADAEKNLKKAPRPQSKIESGISNFFKKMFNRKW